MSESSESRPNEYDPITYHHWQEFELRRLKRSSEDFQQLFEDIMVRAKPGFVRVRPYGNIGDRKCDGLFRQDSIFFQVYSPDELGQGKVQKKIDEDLDGAVSHWGESIKTWVFVYNVKRGVSPGILDTLQEKQKQYPNIKINHLSNDDLWEITRNLSIERRNEILGLPPLNTQTEQIAAYLVHNEDYKIKWRETCRDLLSHWKGLTTNALMRRSGVRFQVNEIFVPLGVIERREKSKHRSNDAASAEQGSELYKEKITPISQNDFFEQVLRQRQSKHSHGKRIAIIGEPGTGKTTQLQKIGDWILEETDGIPLWIPLAEVGAKKLREYLLDDWLPTAIQELEVSPEHRDELGQLLKTGKVWLLLDGVDEMAISDALYQIATQMREGWLQNVRVVLTCRLNVWDAGKNALDGFDVYRNLDFEYPIEVHQLVDKWFAAEPALQQKLKVALEQPGKERIWDMAKNPLRLTLLCYSWQLRQGELPETKAGLYEWFVDAFYEWNKGKVPIKLSAAKRGELNQALGELAKEAIDQETSRFRLREKFISHFLGAADDEDSLFYLALQLGWLNRIGIAAENPLESVYAFFHPTLQEYFAALSIDDWKFYLDHIPRNPGKGIYRVFESQWKEVILLWVGLRDRALEKERVQNFICELIDFEDNCRKMYWYRSLFLAVIITSELQDRSIISRIINQVIKIAFGFFDEEKNWRVYPYFMREKAQSSLLEGNLSVTDQQLIEILDSVQAQNAKDEISFFLLSRRTHSHHLLVYLEECLFANDDRTKLMAARSLIETNRYESAIQTLYALTGSSDEGIQLMTVRELSKLKNKELAISETVCESGTIEISIFNFRNLAANNIYSLISHLKLYTNDYSTQDLAKALEDVASNEISAVDGLLKVVTDSSLSEDVKYEAINQLKELEPSNSLIKNLLFDLLNIAEDDWIILGCSARLLEYGFQRSQVAEALIHLLMYTEDDEVCELSADLVVEYCTEESFVLQELVNFLRHDYIDSINVIFAVDCLKKIIKKDQCFYVVSNLKHCLTNETCQENFEHFKSCYDLVWFCAQIMSYPDFYRAWQDPFFF